MKHYKKTLIGSIATLLVGTSCCWVSSLAIGLGGATLLGVAIKWVENFQVQLILLSIILFFISVYLYQNSKKSAKYNR